MKCDENRGIVTWCEIKDLRHVSGMEDHASLYFLMRLQFAKRES